MTHASWKSARRRWRGERPTAELPEQADRDVYANVDTADAVRRALAALPAQQRVVLVLREAGRVFVVGLDAQASAAVRQAVDSG